LLREAGYKGLLIGHLHNGHLAHWSGTELDELSKTLDCIVSCSNFMASTYTKRSQSIAAKSVVAYNGVDLNVFSPTETPRSEKQIFFVGRFSEQKGVLPLVEAFETVFRTHRDAQLVIGGSSGFGTHQESNYVRAVRSKADQLINKGAQIKFTGYIDHYRQLPDYFRQASIAAFPSVFEEPFGMVICEAMACGTPVVASARGGIPEVLGDAGKLTEPEPTRLASDLLHVIENRPLRKEMSRMGLARVRKFGWANSAERWRSILQTVASREPLSDFAEMPKDSTLHA
jgi:spore coat protein SA